MIVPLLAKKKKMIVPHLLFASIYVITPIFFTLSTSEMVNCTLAGNLLNTYNCADKVHQWYVHAPIICTYFISYLIFIIKEYLIIHLTMSSQFFSCFGCITHLTIVNIHKLAIKLAEFLQQLQEKLIRLIFI